MALFLAAVHMAVLATGSRLATIQKHAGDHAASSAPIVCNFTKASGKPLKWGTNFNSTPIGRNSAGDAAFMGKTNDKIGQSFTEDPLEATNGKMLMRLQEVCCGGKEVHAKFGHHAAEGHWYYSDTLTGFEQDIRDSYALGRKVVFRCSVCGKPLFVLDPATRKAEEFLNESFRHGWPSFRDSDLYIDVETGHTNLDSYDIPMVGLGGNPYSDETRKAAFKALISRGGNTTLRHINAWKAHDETAGPHRIWKSPEFELHCSHCGAHVGHANPTGDPKKDRHARGNRYCIDAGCVAQAG